MIIKKKLKTKIDYQLRTFGISIVLLFLFTFFAINPKIEEVRIDNDLTAAKIEEESNLNALLKEEFEFNMQKITIRQND